MPFNTFQQQVLERVVMLEESRTIAIQKLAKILNKGLESIRRRFTGDTVLSANELEEIAKAYRLPIDELIHGKSDQFLFNFNFHAAKVKKFEDYLISVAKDLQEFSGSSNPHIYYAAEEIPFFIHLFFPKLLSFKFFIYGMTSWNFPNYQDQKFHFGLMSPQFVEMAQQMSYKYATVPTTELWTLSIIDKSLNQLEFLVDIDRFENPDDAIVICQTLLDLTQHMEAMAEVGQKFPPGQSDFSQAGSFDLFFNELAYTGNTILTSNNQGKSLFTTLRHPNYLKSSDSSICDHIEEWLKNLIQNSTSISNGGVRKRRWYFNRLYKKIESTRLNIEASIAGLV